MPALFSTNARHARGAVSSLAGFPRSANRTEEWASGGPANPESCRRSDGVLLCLCQFVQLSDSFCFGFFTLLSLSSESRMAHRSDVSRHDDAQGGPGVFRETRNTAGGTPALPDARLFLRHPPRDELGDLGKRSKPPTYFKCHWRQSCTRRGPRRPRRVRRHTNPSAGDSRRPCPPDAARCGLGVPLRSIIGYCPLGENRAREYFPRPPKAIKCLNRAH